MIDEGTPFDAEQRVVYAMALVCVPADDVDGLTSHLSACFVVLDRFIGSGTKVRTFVARWSRRWLIDR